MRATINTNTKIKDAEPYDSQLAQKTAAYWKMSSSARGRLVDRATVGDTLCSLTALRDNLGPSRRLRISVINILGKLVEEGPKLARPKKIAKNKVPSTTVLELKRRQAAV